MGRWEDMRFKDKLSVRFVLQTTDLYMIGPTFAVTLVLFVPGLSSVRARDV